MRTEGVDAGRAPALPDPPSAGARHAGGDTPSRVGAQDTLARRHAAISPPFRVPGTEWLRRIGASPMAGYGVGSPERKSPAHRTAGGAACLELFSGRQGPQKSNWSSRTDEMPTDSPKSSTHSAIDPGGGGKAILSL